MVTIESEEDLEDLNQNYLPIGGGSNIIINPEIQQPLIKVSPSFFPTSVENDKITCSAGLPLAVLIKTALSNELSGLEFATGVPATIGGMVYMNFECWGIQISDMIHSVFVYTPDKGCHWQSRSDYQSGYRWTSFHEDNAIILAVCLKLTPNSPLKIKALMTKYLNERKQKQPIMNATFGSVFKNPLPKKAGQVVDEIGLKGTKVGDAMVSNKHANFFENIDDASYEDTINLINIIQNKVNTMYNIKLECEVQILD